METPPSLGLWGGHEVEGEKMFNKHLHSALGAATLPTQAVAKVSFSGEGPLGRVEKRSYAEKTVSEDFSLNIEVLVSVRF